MEENTFVNERQSQEQNTVEETFTAGGDAFLNEQNKKIQADENENKTEFSANAEEALIRLISIDPEITELPRKTLERFINGASTDEIVTDYENMLLKKKINDLQLMLKAEKKNAFNKKTAVTGIESDGALFGENEFVSGLYSVLA